MIVKITSAYLTSYLIQIFNLKIHGTRCYFFFKTSAKNLPENSQDFVSFKSKYCFEKALSKSKILNKTDLDFEGRTVQNFD